MNPGQNLGAPDGPKMEPTGFLPDHSTSGAPYYFWRTEQWQSRKA